MEVETNYAFASKGKISIKPISNSEKNFFFNSIFNSNWYVDYVLEKGCYSGKPAAKLFDALIRNGFDHNGVLEKELNNNELAIESTSKKFLTAAN